MKDSLNDYQQFERRNQLFQNQTRENDLRKAFLEKQLQYEKLFQEFALTQKKLEEAQEQKNRIKDILKNLIPQNKSLKNSLHQFKGALNSIQKREQEWMQQLNEKDKLIDELKEDNERMRSMQDQRRRSDLSSRSEIMAWLQEKTKLQEQIQELKKQRLISNQGYEQKLQKKDELLKKINQQSQQTELYYKDLVSKKSRIVESLEDEIKNIRKLNQKVQSQTRFSINEKQSNHTQQIQQLKTIIENLNAQLQQCRMSTTQQIRAKSKIQMQASVNVSKQVQLKQQYILLLEESRRQLANNQLQLQKTFSLLENKQNQLRFKEQQISQYKSSIGNYKQHVTYLERQVTQLQSNKSGMLAKLEQKDQTIKNFELKIQQYKKQIETQRIKIQQTIHQNQNLSALKNPNSKNSSLTERSPSPNPSTQQFFDCNNQKQVLKDELRQTKKSLQNEKGKLQEYILVIKNITKQNEKLREENELMRKSNISRQGYGGQTNRTTNGNNSMSTNQPLSSEAQSQIISLKQQNMRLKQKIHEKSKKLQTMQSQMKHEYETRIRLLQRQIYRLTELLDSKKESEKREIQGNNKNITSENKREQQRQLQTRMNNNNVDQNNFLQQQIVIDDLDQQFQLDLQTSKPPVLNKQQTKSDQLLQFGQVNFNQLNFNSRNSISSKKSQNKNQPQNGNIQIKNNSPQMKSRNSQQSDKDPVLKAKYQELRVQNQSLKAHLQRLSGSLSQSKQMLSGSFQQNQRLIEGLKQVQSKLQSSEKKCKSLQSQIKQYKEQLQRYQSLKQLLKLQKAQSKQRAQLIKQLEHKLSTRQRQLRQLKEDYHNLQAINEQTNEKYKKTLQTFKKQMNQMNQEILKQKGLIEDKKKQMKRIQNQYMDKISNIEDENLSLRSKLKKQQLHITKIQQKLKELQQENIEKVIITRTQFVNYKQTQKRLEDIQEQINSLLKDKDKIITEKKSLQNYYQEQITLLKSNAGNQREKLLKKLTETQQARADYQLKFQKLKEIVQKKRKQCIELQSNSQKLSKQNYQIKLELSGALSQTNLHLVKSKTMGEKLINFENEFQELKMSYETLLLEKSKNQKNKLTTNGMRVQLQMAYKQIQKLNDVLMLKQKQINYLLTQSSIDPYSTREYLHQEGPHDSSVRQRKKSREFSYSNQPSFGRMESQPHYKSSKNQNYGYNDFIKQNNNNNRKSSDTIRDNNYESHYKQHKNTNQIPKQRYIGGFPAQYCTFAPQYHKI